MGGPQPFSSPRRWVVLRALADAGTPLGIRELTACTGIPAPSVWAVLVRPVRAGWVNASHVPNRPGRPEHRVLYTITDTGHQQLAAHTTTDKEG